MIELILTDPVNQERIARQAMACPEHTPAEIARLYSGVTPAMVLLWKAAYRDPPPLRREPAPPVVDESLATPRQIALATRYRALFSVTPREAANKVAGEFGISRQRVWQLLQAYESSTGIPLPRAVRRRRV